MPYILISYQAIHCNLYESLVFLSESVHSVESDSVSRLTRKRAKRRNDVYGLQVYSGKKGANL